MRRPSPPSAVLGLSTIIFIARFANAASSPQPTDFAGVAIGTSLRDLKERYPEVRRNPDSDRQFQVYQVPALKGADVKTPGAFNIYNGRALERGHLVNLELTNAIGISSYFRIAFLQVAKRG